jgi:hypothetical protein
LFFLTITENREATTHLLIQDSYRESALRTILIYHPNIELINCGFHRGVLGASSALTRSHIGYPIPDGVTATMARLDVAKDPGGLETGAESFFSILAFVYQINYLILSEKQHAGNYPREEGL